MLKLVRLLCAFDQFVQSADHAALSADRAAIDRLGTSAAPSVDRLICYCAIQLIAFGFTDLSKPRSGWDSLL